MSRSGTLWETLVWHVTQLTRQTRRAKERILLQPAFDKLQIKLGILFLCCSKTKMSFEYDMTCRKSPDIQASEIIFQSPVLRGDQVFFCLTIQHFQLPHASSIWSHECCCLCVGCCCCWASQVHAAEEPWACVWYGTYKLPMEACNLEVEIELGCLVEHALTVLLYIFTMTTP